MKAFFGLLYLAGGLKLNYTNIIDIWEERDVIDTFRLTMPYKRFKFLMSSIRFDDIRTRNHRKKPTSWLQLGAFTNK